MHCKSGNNIPQVDFMQFFIVYIVLDSIVGFHISRVSLITQSGLYTIQDFLNLFTKSNVTFKIS